MTNRTIPPYAPTRYEVIAHNGPRTILVGYAARRSQAGLADLLLTTTTSPRNSSPTMRLELVAWLTNTESTAWKYAHKASRGVFCGEWRVEFSGRTQREACIDEPAESIYHLDGSR